MTRFKEKRRIERALQSQDIPELQSALSYCRMRLRLAEMKGRRKHWSKPEERILKVMEQAENDSRAK